jgi:uncharacterized protein (TIGR03790 family)
MAFFNKELSQVPRSAVWAACLLWAAPVLAQPGRVLIVYNSFYPESLEVAEYYRTARNIPVQNMCAITTEIDSAISANIGSYPPLLRDPIRACLNAVGPANILYIVLSYRTPYSFSPDLTPPYYWYAVDSYVSDIWDRYSTQYIRPYPAAAHGYFAENQNQGNYFPPFISLASFRTGPKSTPLYAVWRLDGPSAAVAKGLVDKAIAGEQSGGPVGQGCFDMRRDPLTAGDNSYDAGEWEVYRAARAAEQAGFTITEDFQVPEISCPNTAFFTGWYSLANYMTSFSWVNGSYGIHIDSNSMTSPRGGTSWGAGAIADGITAVSGSVEEPYLNGLPRMAGIIRNLFEGAYLGDAVLRNTRWLRWRIVNVGDPLYRPYPSGRAPFNVQPAENALRLTARQVIGGKPTTGTVFLTAVAPPGGTVVNLSKTGPVTVPASVMIPPGQRSVNFPITTPAVTSVAYSQITAVSGAITLKNDLQMYPLLGSVGVDASTVTGGQSVQATVYLNDRAPLGGALVSLQSNNGAAQVPVSVTVPQGQLSVNFTITTSVVGANTPVVITATYAGAQEIANLTVVP